MANATGHIAALESSLEETYDWLNRITLELDHDDQHLALAALRAVLHAVRDYLTVEQSAHLSAQFPMLIRGLYFEQWTPGAPHPDRGVGDFLMRIEEHLKGYEDRCAADDAASAVFAVLEESISGGAEKIKLALPKPIRALWL